jgi:uncharacterized membrane protein YjfL (UPF0719 family)
MNPPVLLANMGIYWQLPILIVVISLVYSATRFEDWNQIIREAVRWVVRMTLFLVGIVLVLSGLSLDESSLILRVILAAIGVALELSLLFIK